MDKKSISPFTIVGILIGGCFFYFLMSFLYNFYLFGYQRVLITFFWGVLFGLAGYYFVLLGKKAHQELTNRLSVGILFLNFLFSIAIVFLSLQYPTLFPIRLFLMGATSLPIFILITLVAIFFANKLFKITIEKWNSVPVFFQKSLSFFDANLLGFMLAGIFFIIYFSLALVFNRTEFTLIDSLFEADNTYWLYFLGMESENYIPRTRAVHPLAYIILRPITWIVSFFLNGNTYYSILIVIATSGAFSVFLLWLFLKENGQKTYYALLFSSLLGATATHLVFGSFAESYIFSATALLLFLVLLQRKKNSLKVLVFAGLIVFGITISNMAQTVIATLFLRKNIKLLLRYVFFLLIFAVLLSIVNNYIYPYDSGFFFIPSDLLHEQKYMQSIWDFPTWKAVGRIYSVIRNMFFYTIAAPSSFFILPDPGKPLPRISFFSFSPGQFSHSEYDGTANIILFSWIFLLMLSGLIFLWMNRKRQNWDTQNNLFSLALLGIIFFNFIFHVFYGEDPFLYSADWAYALVLFTALSLDKFSQFWWGKFILLAFLGMLMINNFQFLHRFMEFMAQSI